MEPRSIANLFYCRPRLLVLTLLLIVVAGLSSLQVIPRAEDPKITDRFATIFTTYPGASAARVEALVTERIETELHEIEEIQEINSSSRAGISTVVMEIDDSVGPEQADEVWSRVRDRLGDVERRFPAGVGKPDFEEFSSTAWTVIVGLRWTLPGAPDRVVLGRLADELGDGLRLVPGTEKVRVYGEPREEITVEVDPARLAAFGLSADDVARAVQGRDSKIPAGQVRGEGNRLFVEISGELDSLARIRDLPIAFGDGGRSLRLADLGTVRKGYKAPDEALALISGETGVVVASRMIVARRIDTWAAATRARIAAFEQRLPRGVEPVLLFDQSRYTEARLQGLFVNFLTAAGLVMLVILLSMGWRSAVLVGSALPLTTLMVLQGMNVFGVPINQMSVTGLIIALGLLIDNAIIMVDETRHRLESGMLARDAVSASVRALAVPLAGSTGTTILAFMPIVLMPGPSGEFVGAIGKSVILALVSSLFLAMTVVPALAGLLDRVGRRERGGERGWLDRGLAHAGATRVYVAALGQLVRRPALALAVAFVLPALGFVAATRLEEQFFPPADRDQFAIELRLPWEATIEQTRRVALAARDELLRHPAVEDVHWFLGESAPKFYYNMIESRRSVDFYAQALVQLKGADDGPETIRALQERLDALHPQAQVLVKQLEQGPPFDAPVELRVYGPDLAELHQIGLELRRELAAVPGITHTRATMEGGQPKLLLALDEERAHLVGFDNAGIARYLQGSLEGSTGGSMIESTEDLPVRIRVRGEDRAAVGPVQALALRNGDAWTPLSALTDARLVPDAATIPHRDGRRINTVQGFLVAGMLPNVVLDELRRRLAARSFALPPGYELELGGEAAERDEAIGKLAGAAFVLMALMAASLVLSFNSFRLAAIITGVALLSVGLSTGALFCFGYPFGFMAIVGTMGLVGVAVNDSIVVLAALKNNHGAMQGDPDAIVQTVLRATRHLVSTSLTTMVGFTPLMLAGGGFWPPVAVAIGGGVAGATLLAVTFVPALFVLSRRRVVPQGDRVPIHLG